MADESTTQLQHELQDSISRSFDNNRPILHHLNADSSWLIQIPRPTSTSPPTRHFYNILIDPWLSGPQSDVASWFSSQWHAIEPKIRSIAQLEALLRDAEQMAAEHHGTTPATSATLIDAVVVCHEFTDHCHKETLLEVHACTPVFATAQAAKLIRSWRYFDAVHDTPPFSTQQPDWRATSVDPLPSWLGIARIVNPDDALYYHSAILVTFASQRDGKGGNDSAEAIIYTPHGILPEALAAVPAGQPSIRTLALLHGLHDIKIAPGKQLNLGAKNGLKAQRVLKAAYWIGTHDEVKTAAGLVKWLLSRKVWTVSDALATEKESRKGLENASADVKYLELGNGESVVLV